MLCIAQIGCYVSSVTRNLRLEEFCHQLIVAEATGILQAAQAPQLLDGGQQAVVVVRRGVVNNAVIALRGNGDERRIGATQGHAIHAGRTVTAAIVR